MSRLLGLFIVILWAVAFTTLIAYDVAPYWRTQEPPRGRLPEGEYQVGIFDKSNRRIGRSWTSLSPQPDLLAVQSLTELSDLSPLRGLVRVPAMVIDTSLSISLPDERLQSLEVSLREHGDTLAELHAHQVGQDYSCVARVGALQRHFSLDARATAVLSDSLRPFNYLPNLHVGQTWRIRMLDVVELLRDQTAAITPQLVRVTARESIEHQGRRVSCFRIESDNAVAWADDAGRVLLQRVELPLLGTLEIRDEPFDSAARAAARRSASGIGDDSASSPKKAHGGH